MSLETPRRPAQSRRLRTCSALAVGLLVACVVALLAARGGSDVKTTSEAEPKSAVARMPSRDSPVVGSRPSLERPPRGMKGGVAERHLRFEGHRGTCEGTVFRGLRERAATVLCRGLPDGHLALWTRRPGGRFRLMGYPIRDGSGDVRTVVGLAPPSVSESFVVSLEGERAGARPAKVLARTLMPRR